MGWSSGGSVGLGDRVGDGVGETLGNAGDADAAAAPGDAAATGTDASPALVAGLRPASKTTPVSAAAATAMTTTAMIRDRRRRAFCCRRRRARLSSLSYGAFSIACDYAIGVLARRTPGVDSYSAGPALGMVRPDTASTRGEAEMEPTRKDASLPDYALVERREMLRGMGAGQEALDYSGE